MASDLEEGPIAPGTPALRRRILVDPRPGVVRGDLEDDFHHFIVWIHHDGERITHVETGAPRFPWTTCPAAGPFMGERLVGTRLDEAATFDAQLSHCTHLFDLAVITAAHARDTTPTLFSMIVFDPVDGRSRAEMRRNGVLELAWNLAGQTILPPGPAAGRDLRQQRRWIAELPPALREAAQLIRRTVFISGGRRFDTMAMRSAADVPGQSGACYTFHPDRAAGGIPMPGAKWDFTNRADPPLAARVAEVAASR